MSISKSSVSTSPRLAEAATLISELQALREVSHHAARASDVTQFLESAAHIILRIPGVYRLQLENEDVVSWGQTSIQEPTGTAVIELVPGTQLRLTFGLKTCALESPLKLVRFLVHQVQTVLSISDFESQNQKLKDQIGGLEKIVARRKVIHRGRAILCQNHRVSDQEALILLRRYARLQRCTLHEVAAAIVACEPRMRTGQSRRPRNFISAPQRHVQTASFPQSLSA